MHNLPHRIAPQVTAPVVVQQETAVVRLPNQTIIRKLSSNFEECYATCKAEMYNRVTPSPTKKKLINSIFPPVLWGDPGSRQRVHMYICLGGVNF